jgi:hypothetical protein
VPGSAGAEALVAEMIEADLREAERDHFAKSSGYPVYAPHEQSGRHGARRQGLCRRGLGAGT